MKRKLKQGLVGLVVGTTLGLGIAGCMQNPQAGDFYKKDPLVAIPSLLPIMAIHGGSFHFDKIIENNETIGYKITKHHWTKVIGIKSKPKTQEIKIPGAKNMGVKNFQDRIWISYDLNGQRKLEEYNLGLAGNKCELKSKYIVNENGKKIKIKK